MAKRFPERYQPGELQRTRNNLGFVSAEEATKIARALGGHIGVEKPDEVIQHKYERLRDLNRRKSDRILPPERVKSMYSKSGTPDTIVSEAVQAERKQGFFARMQINFLASRSEYGIKTFPGAVAGLFSWLLPVHDYVNPKFIIRGDGIFFRHIEGLVLSVRGLLALNQKHPANRLRHPFFVGILSVLKNWDIEGLHQELTHLQIAPRRLLFRQCNALARLIFGPIMRLADLSEGTSVASALKRLYDLDILSLPANHPDIDKVKSYYHTAVTKYQYVFRVLKRKCYPLLMKTAKTDFSTEYNFYLAARAEILAFLGLEESDVLQIPGDVDTAATTDEVEEVQEDPRVELAEMPSLQQGFEILERLFPGAGWNSLTDFPDLYPYFQPLIMFPRGFELVPPDDPFHQIVVLASILQELFYGFRTIDFGTVSVESRGRINPGDAIDTATDKWRQFLIELVSQHYLSTLYEYCREIEKSPQFATSVYGAKQRDYLSWLKKLYILPHLVIGRPKPPDAVHTVPRLYILASELREILGAVARDLADPGSEQPTSVKNPWSSFEFEIESDISRRFRNVLQLYREDASNANLLLYTYSIVLLLEALLNEESSHYYPMSGDELYRRENDDSPVPMYTVPVADPGEFFKEADDKIRLQNRPAEQTEAVTRDRLTDVLNMAGLRNHLDQHIFLFKQQKIPFVLISVLIRDFQGYCDANGEEAGISKLQIASQTLKNTIREYKDVPARAEDSLFMVLLPGTVREESVNLAIRLFVAFQELEDPALAVSLGIVQFEPAWGREKLIKLARQAARESQGLPPPSLSLYDGKINRFQTLSEVHGS